jgi:electron transport complex protein RnfG
MKSKQSVWNTAVRPVVVLLVICLVAAVALAAVNAVTAPVIAENEERSALETYAALLPEADSFTELTSEIEGVTTVLRADNGAGYIVVASSKGYNGEVPAAVSFDQEGNIIRVIMMDNDETVGVGSKVKEESFTGQFAGQKAQELEYAQVDAVSNATYSSKAAVAAINLAIQAYQQVRGD